MVKINTLDKDKNVGTILHAKLNTWGFSFNAINAIQIYFFKPFQRVNMNNNFSNWLKILLELPPRSILGSLLFNVFINGIFYFLQETYICISADDNSLYSTRIISK